MTNTNKLLAAVAAGVAIGSILGILFAPDSGEHTRKKIADGTKKLSDDLLDKMNEGKDRLSSVRNNMRTKVDSLKEKVEEYTS